MNPQVQQAYELLAALDADMQAMYQKVKAIHNLLQVPQVQQQSPMGQQQQAVQQAGATQGQTSVEVALWDKPVSPDQTPRISGVIKLNDTSHSLVLFQSKPNDKAMVFNGYVLHPNDDRQMQLSEKKIGGAFLFNNPDGLLLSVMYDESPLINNADLKIPLGGNPRKQPGDNQPALKGGVTVPFVVVKDVNDVLTQQGINLPAQPSQPADPQPQQNTGILSGFMQQPQGQGHNNLNQLTQPQQNGTGGQVPTQGGSILGNLLS